MAEMSENRLSADDILKLFKEARLSVQNKHGGPHILVEEPVIVKAVQGKSAGILGVTAQWRRIHRCDATGGFRLTWTPTAMMFSAWTDWQRSHMARVEQTYRVVPAYDYIKIGLMGVHLL